MLELKLGDVIFCDAVLVDCTKCTLNRYFIQSDIVPLPAF